MNYILPYFCCSDMEIIKKILLYLALLANSEQQPTNEQAVQAIADSLGVRIEIVTTEPTPEPEPVTYIEFVGLSPVVSGTIEVQAVIPDSVVVIPVKFTLEGEGQKVEWFERVAPYFFNGDASGKATGYDTKQLTNGEYNLTVETGAIKEFYSFEINNGVLPVPTPNPEPTPTPNPIPAPTGDRILFSNTEVQLWKDRLTQGKYIAKSDVSTNSPGDWNLIVQGKDRYLANTEADNWYGPTGSGLVQKWATPEPKNKSRLLVQAAFYAMLKDDARVKSVVRINILKMVRTKRIDFSDRSQWTNNMETINPGFFVPDWALRIAYSYYFCQDEFSVAERKEVEQYLVNVAEWSYITINSVMNKNWAVRGVTPAGSYQNPNCVDYTGKCKVTWDNGYKVPVFTQYTYNNRAWMFIRYLAFAGNQFNIDKYKNEASQFFKEWVQYGVYPDGTMGELYRGQGGYSWSPGNTGYYYAGIVLASAIQTADYFWRGGDKSLYDYTFTNGLYGSYDSYIGTGNRGLKKAITTFLSYHTTDKTKRVNGLPLTGHWDNNSDGYVLDGNAAIANKYYQDSFIKQAYLRTHPQAIGYPAKVESMAGNSGYGGVLGTLPGVAFMYYGLE